jgi:hypothetical protein
LSSINRKRHQKMFNIDPYAYHPHYIPHSGKKQPRSDLGYYLRRKPGAAHSVV